VSFVHLHCHSSHSLLDGLGNPAEWVDTAKKKGMTALALSDHGSCSSALAFYKAAKEKGITPIVGTEFYVNDDPAFRPEKKNERPPRFHMTVLAKNWNGLQSIFKQSAIANQQFYYKPVLSLKQCENFNDCVVMTGCAVGILSHPYYKKIVTKLHDIYGGDFYIEIMPHWLEIQKIVNERAFVICHELGISPVATNDCHYPNAEDTLTHDILLAIQTNRKPNDTKMFSFIGSEEPMDGLYLKNTSEMIHSFKPWVQNGTFDLAFVNKSFMATVEIAKKCSGLEIPQLNFNLPSIPLLKGATPAEESNFLVKKVMQGWTEILPTGIDPAVYRKRLRHELKVISKIGAVRYFLIVWDIVREAKERDVLCGFGRGSAGGSLVAYLLRIVGLDPLKHELYFERFLREDRIDMPDIDLDFAGKDRDVVIQYIKDTYGEENVCQISTSSIMHGKTAFRDVARVYGVEFNTAIMLSKRIDNDLSLEENFNDDSVLSDFRIKNPEIVRHATRLDGQLRSKGLHAGGVIISEDGFDDRGVLEYRKKAFTINWNMEEVENFGLLKVDILGLSNLSVLNDTSRLVKKRTGKGIDYFKIEPNDPKVLALFSDGFTAGFFQFESTGITGLCKRLAPITNFETLVHVNALYRPGPLDSGMVESYVRRYRKEEGISYNHPSETEITRETLGMPIFQEQIMAYFVRLAGFSWPEADTMRKIIAKSKGIEKLEEKRPIFVKGCEEVSGIKEDTANIIYDQIVKFGEYGFNKSHSADYGLISYLTAWAKLHYPMEFICSLLRSVTDESDQTDKYIKELNRLGGKVLGPDINRSEETFTSDGDDILVGFSSVKGVGPTAAQKIVEGREKVGEFISFEHFMENTERRTVNKRVVEALAKAGAFNSICKNAKWIIDWYPAWVKGGKTASEIPHPGAYTDFDSRVKDSMKIECVPGIFTGDDIEVEAQMEIDKVVLEMLQGQIRECDQCELRSASGPVPFHFGRDNQILVVSQKVNSQEESADRPMVGKIGAQVEEIFRERLGLTPGKFLMANMFQCRPPGDKLEKEVMERVECAKIWLSKLIKATKPGVIFAMGGAAHTFFTKKTFGINAANGTTLWMPEYQCLVVFAIHPGQLYFDSTGEKKDMFVKAVDKLKNYL